METLWLNLIFISAGTWEWLPYLLGFIITLSGVYALGAKWIDSKREIEEKRIKASLEIEEVKQNRESIRLNSEALAILNKEVEMLKEFQRAGIYSEKELRLLIDRLVSDLKFLMEQLFESNVPKRNIKKHYD